MTYKAYVDNIKAQTGKSPDDFLDIAERRGFVRNGKVVAKHAELLAWLKSEIGLGHGHAMAIIMYIQNPELAKKKILEDAKKAKAKE